MPRIGDLAEKELLQRLHPFCPPDIIGDDAAILNSTGDRAVVVTTDTLVDGIHFSDKTTSPEDVGWRAIAANLSDLAAMGATPTGLTIALGLNLETPVEWVDRLYRGMQECCQQYHTALVGGDVTRSPVNTLSITALGTVDRHRAILRKNARPGDAIVVTGVHGASRAGLELLLHPETGENLHAGDRNSLIRAHQRPQPRLDVIPILQELTKNAPRIAGMDSSDGLADAVLQTCQLSKVGAKVDRVALIVPPGMLETTASETVLEWILFGGEDFELVLSLPPEIAVQLVDRLGENAAIVGNITQETDIVLIDSTKPDVCQPLNGDRAFKHFG